VLAASLMSATRLRPDMNWSRSDTGSRGWGEVGNDGGCVQVSTRQQQEQHEERRSEDSVFVNTVIPMGGMGYG
jgi:hypothetical protein